MTRSDRSLIVAFVVAMALLPMLAMRLVPTDTAAAATPKAHKAQPARLAAARPRAVALTDARVAPDYLRLVRPSRTRCLPSRIVWGGTEVSAYRWNGRALGPERWGRLRTTRTHGDWWRMPGTRDRVEYDGACFHNETRQAVLVAVWLA